MCASSLCRVRAFFLLVGAVSAFSVWYFWLYEGPWAFGPDSFVKMLGGFFGTLIAVSAFEIFALSFGVMRTNEDGSYCIDERSSLFRYYQWCFEHIYRSLGWADSALTTVGMVRRSKVVPEQWSGRIRGCSMVWLLMPFAFVQMICVGAIAVLGFVVVELWQLPSWSFELLWSALAQLHWGFWAFFTWLVLLAILALLSDSLRDRAKRAVYRILSALFFGGGAVIAVLGIAKGVELNGLEGAILGVLEFTAHMLLIAGASAGLLFLVYWLYRLVPALQNTVLGQWFELLHQWCPDFRPCSKT